MLKSRTSFTIANPVVIIIMIVLVPATFPNASGIQGVPSPPNIYPCGLVGAMCSYDLNVNGTNHAIKYIANGPLGGTNPNAIILNEIKLIPSNKSIMLNVTVAKGEPIGYLTLFLPRSLIDARNSTNNEIHFAVFDNGRPLDYHIGCFQGCGLPGRIHERPDLADTYVGRGIVEDARAFSLGFEAGNHNIEMIGTTVTPEFAFSSILLIIGGILIALVLATVRFAPISRFPTS